MQINARFHGQGSIFFNISKGTSFLLNGMFQSQTYPEEETPCHSKYWKIYFPDREINLALFRIFFFFSLALFCSFFYFLLFFYYYYFFRLFAVLCGGPCNHILLLVFTEKAMHGVFLIFLVEALLSLKNVWVPPLFVLDTKITC